MTIAWQARRMIIRDKPGETIALTAGKQPLSAGDAIAGWRDEAAFRDFFLHELAATAYPAFFWEMPPASRKTLADPFECVVISNEALAQMRADDSDFSEQLKATVDPVVSFANLGGDALLIAPRRLSKAECYAHISAFVRGAPREQQHALLQRLAEETEAMLNTGRRFWISTSGLGVPWVHVRLDLYPKYYQHRPYAEGKVLR